MLWALCAFLLSMMIQKYFKQMKILKEKLKLNELSMGMSSDYLDAIENSATYIRVVQVYLEIEIRVFLFLFSYLLISTK